MDFLVSTQRELYTFTPEQLAQKRETNHVQCSERAMAARAGCPSPSNTAPPPEPLTPDEEQDMLFYFQSKIQDYCKVLRLPLKVQNTASAYLKRYYLVQTVMDVAPQHIMLTCLYLAGKVEDYYKSAADLGKVSKTATDIILRRELPVLEALQYHLIVHSPGPALEGFCAHLRDTIAQGGILEPGMQGLTESSLEAVRNSALGALNAIMLSDATLIYTPAQCALAALRSGCQNIKVSINSYLEHLASSSSSSSTASEGARATSVQELRQLLDGVDKFGMAAYTRSKTLKADLGVIKQLETKRAAFGKVLGKKSGDKAKGRENSTVTRTAGSAKPAAPTSRTALSPRNAPQEH